MRKKSQFRQMVLYHARCLFQNKNMPLGMDGNLVSALKMRPDPNDRRLKLENKCKCILMPLITWEKV